MIYKLKSNRVYRSYFGGKRLDSLYGAENPNDSQFPEEWVASTVRAFNVGREDIVEGLSITENDETLCDIIAKDPETVLGKAQFKIHGGKMSILVKLLDAAERLFIQCHPTIPFAKEFFGSDFGKTECWYILSAEPDSCVYLGFNKNITREKWIECFEKQDVDGMLGLMHKISVKKGDLVFVAGGVPHAIGGGCLLCELQEPSDLMVIPERTSKSGITLPDKKMHGGLGFQKMFDCFEYVGYSEDELKAKYVRHPKLKPNTLTPIVDGSLTEKFRMDCALIDGETLVEYRDKYAVAVVIEGNCELRSKSVNISLKAGDELFITADEGEFKLKGEATLMICTPNMEV